MGATAEREGVDREAVLRALVSGGGGGGDDDANLDPEVMAGSSRPLVHSSICSFATVWAWSTRYTIEIVLLIFFFPRSLDFRAPFYNTLA